MATIDIHNLSGEKVGTLDLADEVFGAVNEDLLWEAVKHYRAAQRAGTHATKNKKLVSGAGKKLWKQKGTGRARVGSIRSPLWRHAGQEARASKSAAQRKGRHRRTGKPDRDFERGRYVSQLQAAGTHRTRVSRRAQGAGLPQVRGDAG